MGIHLEIVEEELVRHDHLTEPLRSIEWLKLQETEDWMLQRSRLDEEEIHLRAVHVTNVRCRGVPQGTRYLERTVRECSLVWQNSEEMMSLLEFIPKIKAGRPTMKIYSDQGKRT